MRILALVTDAFGGHGGIAQYNRDLTTALGSLDNIQAVHILPRHGEITGPIPADVGRHPHAAYVLDRDAAASSPPKLHQHPATPNRFLYSLRAFRLALRYKPDLIFCGHLYVAPLAWLLAKLMRKPFWLQLHGIDAWDPPNRLIRYAAERATHVTAVSRYTRRRFLAWSRNPPYTVRVLPNTVDPRFTPGPKRPELVQRYGLHGKRVLLTVARIAAFERYKGHDRVIQVLPQLIQSIPNLCYLIAGGGDLRPHLEQLARQHGVSAQVIFAGQAPDEDLPDIYRLADVFVMPSRKEGFGIVFLEAAACGVPVIGGNTDGSVDALAEGAIGAAINPAEPAELVAAIRAAIANGAASPSGVERFNRDNFSLAAGKIIALT